MEGRPTEPELGPGELERALASVDPARRAAALLKAADLPGIEALVIGALSDPDPEVRRSAARALSGIAGAGGTRALVHVTSKDPSPKVRAEAVAALGRLLRDRRAGGL